MGTAASDTSFPAAPSLGRRYGYKLSAGVLGLVAALGTHALVPRALGPEAFGQFAFLTNFFGTLAGMVSMGVSLAFVTKLAGRPDDVKLIAFFRYIVLTIGVTMLVFAAAVFVLRLDVRIWPGIASAYVWTALVLGFGLWSIDALSGMNDALGLTVPAERTRIVTKLVGLVVVVAMFRMGALTLPSYFAWSILAVLLLGSVWLRLLRRNPSLREVPWTLSAADRRSYGREFVAYCAPLAVYSVVNAGGLLFDRWLLQRFAGAREQGFYGLSYQLGALIFLGTSAIVPLLTREFSIAHSRGDVPHMARLFGLVLPRLFFVAAFFAAFASVNAGHLVTLFGGQSFAAAAVPMAIMAFYPMHQTYGQVSGGLFYATGRTGLYRNIGVAGLVLGMPISFLLFAPPEVGGFGLGATALAAKMVIFQVIMVNVQLYFNTKLLRVPLSPFIMHQTVTVIVLVAAALGAAAVVSRSSLIAGPITIPQLIVAGLSYGAVVLFLVALFPRLAGLDRRDLSAIGARARRLLSPE